MEERVSVIRGKRPILVVAPHGEEDKHTGIISEILIEDVEGFGVINRGWKKGKNIDYKNEIANCNNLYHCTQPVVKQEFYEPIRRIGKEMIRKYNELLVICIMGLTDTVLEEDIGYVFNQTNQLPYCQKWKKDYLIYALGLRDKHNIACEAVANGNYSKNRNYTPLIAEWGLDMRVDAIQIEIASKIRNTKQNSRATGQILGICVCDMLEHTSGWRAPWHFSIRTI